MHRFCRYQSFKHDPYALYFCFSFFFKKNFALLRVSFVLQRSVWSSFLIKLITFFLTDYNQYLRITKDKAFCVFKSKLKQNLKLTMNSFWLALLDFQLIDSLLLTSQWSAHWPERHTAHSAY